MGRLRRHWKGLAASGIGAVVVLAVGVPYVYIHVVVGSQPAALTLDSVPSATAAGSAAAGSADGTWTVGAGSTAGYRVHETLAGQSTTAVGRTTRVTGSLVVAGSEVTSGSFTVQMASVTSDRSQRDQQFAGRIMDTAQYPTGTFRLTSPIQLGSVPAVGVKTTETVTGELTLHGTTKPVTFTAQAERTGGALDVVGSIDIAYADYGIDNPSFGSFVSVGNSGTIEFLLVSARK